MHGRKPDAAPLGQVVGVSAKAGSVAKKYNNLAITISTLVTQAVSVGMVIWGVYRIADGTMTMGGLIGSNILVGRAMAPLMQIASLLTRLQNSRMSLRRSICCAASLRRPERQRVRGVRQAGRLVLF